jgi:hypothetical protein
MVIGGAGKGDEDCGLAGGRDFSDGAGSGAAYEQVGAREHCGHVVDEFVDFSRDAGLAVRGLDALVVALSGLMEDV